MLPESETSALTEREVLEQGFIDWPQVEKLPGFNKIPRSQKLDLLDNWAAAAYKLANYAEGGDREELIKSLDETVSKIREPLDQVGIGETVGTVAMQSAQSVVSPFATVTDGVLAMTGQGGLYDKFRVDDKDTKGNEGKKQNFSTGGMIKVHYREAMQAAGARWLTDEADRELTELGKWAPQDPMNGMQPLVDLRQKEMDQELSPYRRDTPMRLMEQNFHDFLKSPEFHSMPDDERIAKMDAYAESITTLAQGFWEQDEEKGVKFRDQPGRRWTDPETLTYLQRFQETRNPIYLDHATYLMTRSAKDVSIDKRKAELTAGLPEFAKQELEISSDITELAVTGAEIATGAIVVDGGIDAIRAVVRAGKLAGPAGRAARREAAMKLGRNLVGAGGTVAGEVITEDIASIIEDPLMTDAERAEIRKDAAKQAAVTVMMFGAIGAGTRKLSAKLDEKKAKAEMEKLAKLTEEQRREQLAKEKRDAAAVEAAKKVQARYSAEGLGPIIFGVNKPEEKRAQNQTLSPVQPESPTTTPEYEAAAASGTVDTGIVTPGKAPSPKKQAEQLGRWLRNTQSGRMSVTGKDLSQGDGIAISHSDGDVVATVIEKRPDGSALIDGGKEFGRQIIAPEETVFTQDWFDAENNPAATLGARREATTDRLISEQLIKSGFPPEKVADIIKERKAHQAAVENFRKRGGIKKRDVENALREAGEGKQKQMVKDAVADTAAVLGAARWSGPKIAGKVTLDAVKKEVELASGREATKNRFLNQLAATVAQNDAKAAATDAASGQTTVASVGQTGQFDRRPTDATDAETDATVELSVGVVQRKMADEAGVAKSPEELAKEAASRAELSDNQLMSVTRAAYDWVTGGGVVRGPVTESHARAVLATTDVRNISGMIGEGIDISDTDAAAKRIESAIPFLMDAISSTLADADETGKRLHPMDTFPSGQASLIEGRRNSMRPEELAAAAASGKPMSKKAITNQIIRGFKIALRRGIKGVVGKPAGTYEAWTRVIRTKIAGDVDAIAHELGHHLHYLLFPESAATLGREASDFGKVYDHELLKLGAVTTPNGSAEQMRREGVAEWMRHYLIDPDLAVTKAPDFTEFARKEMLDAHPEVKAMLDQVQKMIQQYIAQPDEMRDRASILDTRHVEPTVGHSIQSLNNWMTRSYTAIFEPLHPLWVMGKHLMENGVSKKEAMAAYQLAYNHRGGVAGRSHFDMDGRQSSLDGRDLGPGLRQILGDMDWNDSRDFISYIFSLRAKELDRRKIKHDWKIASPERMADFEKRFGDKKDAFRKFRRNMVDLLVDAGLFSEENRIAMDEDNIDYAPMYQHFESMFGVSIGPTGEMGGNPIKGIKGASGNQYIDPIEATMRDLYLYRSLAERNRIKMTAVDSMSMMVGHGVLGEKVARKMSVVTVSHEDMVRAIRSAFKKGKEPLTDKQIDAMSRGQVELTYRAHVMTNSIASNNGEIGVFRNGKLEVWQIGDQGVFEALTNHGGDIVGKIHSNPAISWMTKPASWVRVGATYAPYFALMNLYRDQLSASVTSKGGLIPFADGVAGIRKILDADPEYQQWIRDGGSGSGFLNPRPEATRDLMAQWFPGDPNATVAHKIRDSWMSSLKSYESVLQVAEESTRLMEYIKLKKKGLTGIEAANASKDITLNFSRGGHIIKAINAFIPFFNAGFQDLDKMTRTFFDFNSWKTKEGRAELGSAWMRAGLNIVTPTMILWGMNKDDEEIKALEPDVRNRNWCFNLRHVPGVEMIMGERESYIVTMQKPFMVGAAFATMPERLADQLLEGDPRGFGEGVRSVFENTIFRGALMEMPAAFSTIWELKTNTSFYDGRSIVSPQAEGMGMLGYDNFTSHFARSVSSNIHQLTDGGISIQPNQIDFVIRNQFASLGALGAQAIDTILVAQEANAVGGDALGEFGREARELGFGLAGVHRFAPKDMKPSAYVDRMYGGIEEITNMLKPVSDTNVKKYATGEIEKSLGSRIALVQRIKFAEMPGGGLYTSWLGDKQKTFGELTAGMRHWETRYDMPKTVRDEQIRIRYRQREAIAREVYTSFPDEIKKKLR